MLESSGLCFSVYALFFKRIPAERGFYDLCARMHTPDVAFMTSNIKGYIIVPVCVCCIYIYIYYTGCNKGGVTVSDAAALLPRSSPRSLDFHCFKSAVRHFCFAYHCRFSPSHSLPCLALSVLRAVITSHYTFSLVVFDQSHELHPTDTV